MTSRWSVWGRFLAFAVITVLVATACGGGSGDTTDDPLSIGLVTNNPNGMRNVAGFIEGMAELGYTEGDNVTYLFAGEPAAAEELDGVLGEMVAANVDLIFTAGTPTGVAAHRATLGTGIPVVFGVIADPIEAGVMPDLSRPGGNMTGVKTIQDHGRRLELLLEMASDVDQVLVPFNPDDAAAASAAEQLTSVAAGLSVNLIFREARTAEDVVGLLDAVPAEVDAIVLVPDSVVNAQLQDILEVAAAMALPTSGPSTAQVEEGALTAFGFVHREAGRQAAKIADHVLRGADPATLPVEDTESFLAINLATASAIGLEISDDVLRQAAVIVRSQRTAVR